MHITLTVLFLSKRCANFCTRHATYQPPLTPVHRRIDAPFSDLQRVPCAEVTISFQTLRVFTFVSCHIDGLLSDAIEL